MPGSVRAALVAAEDADALEADLLVAADGALVGGGRVDREPVVAPVADEMAGERPDGVRAEPPALPRRSEACR